MPRKRKTSENDETQVNGAGAATPNGNVSEPPPRKKRAPRRKATSPTAEDKTAADVAPPEISDEAVRLRAYLIAEERVRRAGPGDAESDWIEARRQLLAERGEG